MLIIVEGPDGSGKSTLIEHIMKRSDRTLVSMLGGRTMTPEEMRRRTYSVLNAAVPSSRVICERFHPLSDDVYRTVFNDRPRAFSPHEIDSAYRRLHEVGAVIVHCRPKKEMPRGSKGDDDPDWDRKIGEAGALLRDHYDRTMNRLAFLYLIPVILYDFTEDSAEEVVSLCAG